MNTKDHWEIMWPYAIQDTLREISQFVLSIIYTPKISSKESYVIPYIII